MLLSTTKVGFVLTLSYYESRIKTLCEGLASANTATKRGNLWLPSVRTQIHATTNQGRSQETQTHGPVHTN